MSDILTEEEWNAIISALRPVRDLVRAALVQFQVAEEARKGPVILAELRRKFLEAQAASYRAEADVYAEMARRGMTPGAELPEDDPLRVALCDADAAWSAARDLLDQLGVLSPEESNQRCWLWDAMIFLDGILGKDAQ